jgi:hypothetical protein
MLRQGGPPHDFVGVQDEMLEQRVLARGQRERLTPTKTTPRARVEFERADPEDGRSRWTVPAANDGSESGQ